MTRRDILAPGCGNEREDLMSEDLERLYSPTIREHANQPRNRRRLPDANRRASGKNPLCGDCVTVYLRLEAEVVQEAAFESFGCALCRASASLMTAALKGATRETATRLAAGVERALTGRETGDEAPLGDDLAELTAARAFPSRVNCVLLPWRAALQAIQQS